MRPAALAALAVEIARHEAVTVKPGGANNPEGRNQYSKGVEDNRVNTTVDRDRNDRNQQTGLLRRLAKQEAATVHKGGQTGNQNAAKDKTNNRITINRSSNHPDTNQGILRRLAKQEAVTVKPGNPTGANQYSRGDGGNVRNTDNSNTPRDKESVPGLLRRLAKQGRDDLLDRVASGELRKDFTPTERVAIAKAIEEEISRGHGGDRKSGGNQVVNRPLEKKSREVAAEKAGFGTVVAVVENHTPKSGMKFAVELNSVH